MSKTIDANMQTHLDGNVTSLAMCWHIIRQDGTEYFFTTHDRNLVIDGDTYKAAHSFVQSAVVNDSSMAVDNVDVMGLLSASGIPQSHIYGGRFDYADIRLFIVNWADLAQGKIKIRRGRIGQVSTTPNQLFKAELRGLTQNLSQSIVEKYTFPCRADVGDTRCGLPFNPDVREASTLYVVDEYIRVATAVGTGYDVYENRIYICTTAGYTGAAEPIYDTTVDSTTTEDGIKATGILTLTNQPSNGQTFTVDGKVYTLQTVLTDVDGNILIGATTADTAANILAGTTLGAGAGTVYATSMTAHTTVDFTAGTGTKINLEAKSGGTAGNSISTTETMSNASFGSSTLSGGLDGAVFTAVEAWSRHGVVDVVTSRKEFETTVTDARAVDGWFRYGVLTWETGNNEGISMEVRNWTNTSGVVELYESMPFDVQVGDTFRIHPGCDKMPTTCKNTFDNFLNYRGFDSIPGQDQYIDYPDAR